jgi:hypothetical protein
MAAKLSGGRIAIESETDLKKHAVSILRRIKEDERGGLMFLLNPVFALEEAGFDFNEEMRCHIRHGLRFGAKSKARIRDLDEAVREIAGRPIDVLSDEQVAVAWVALYAGKSIVMEAFDGSGQKVGEASSPSAQGTVHMPEVRAPGIETLKISGGGNEGLLVRLCVYSGPEKKPGPEKPRPGKRDPAGTAKAAKNSPAGKG